MSRKGAPDLKLAEKLQAERLFFWQLTHGSFLSQYPWEQQYKFAKQELGRQWALDVALPGQRLGIEVQGGIWVQGAHSGGAHQLGDMEKYNALAFLKWHLLQFSCQQVLDGSALRYTEGLMIRWFTGTGGLKLTAPDYHAPVSNSDTAGDPGRRQRLQLLKGSHGRAAKSAAAWRSYQPKEGST